MKLCIKLRSLDIDDMEFINETLWLLYHNYISMVGTAMVIRGKGRGQGSRTLNQLQPIQCPIGPPELEPILQSSSIIVE